EADGTDQVIHLAVQMTPATDPLPIRPQAALPADDASLGRQAVLDENQSSMLFKTRRISASAVLGFGIEQRVQVITTISKAASDPNPGRATKKGAGCVRNLLPPRLLRHAMIMDGWPIVRLIDRFANAAAAWGESRCFRYPAVQGYRRCRRSSHRASHDP